MNFSHGRTSVFHFKLRFIRNRMATQKCARRIRLTQCQKAHDMICGVGEKVENLFL